MLREGEPQRLGDFARAGFQELSVARERLLELSKLVDQPVSEMLGAFVLAADPDAALMRAIELACRHPAEARTLGAAEWHRLLLLIGASSGLGDFFVRQPRELVTILREGGVLRSASQLRSELLSAVGAVEVEGIPFARLGAEEGATALRVRYRELLSEIALYDLSAGLDGDATEVFDEVAEALSDAATAALEAALAVARTTLVNGQSGPAVARERIAGTRLAIIAMGKCGARELNVVSDVDVIFVGDPRAADSTSDSTSESLDADAVHRIATRLATETMRAIHDPGSEPPLWQVDANLRPEGKQGALVRSLGSMLHYYERWAKTWEYQALLKARAVAGDRDLGEQFVAQTRELVWSSGSREDFVGSVQRMRERVTEHIDSSSLDVQLKLGPGGLRDIEFSVQLLQLVHGQRNETLHQAGTLPALEALVRGGFVAREDGERLAADYRMLRVLEHRLQLRDLRRTAIVPSDEHGLRVLARASRLAATGEQLLARWRETKLEIRELHLKIFYAPLLSAVAAIPGGGFALGTEQARDRLQSIGFQDPDGAMRHLAALTKGNSRNARIQRNLLPVLLQWLGDGTDPDFGLLAFRRVSEANRDAHWYLRLLRDGTEAAERLTRVLSTSRYAAELLETMPDAVAWLERDELLRPPALEVLLHEMRALASRRHSIDEAAAALRTVHRREVLRLVLGRLVFVNDDSTVAAGLDIAHTALLDSLLLALRGAAEHHTVPELAIIAMGRFGGKEMGFSSDIDLIAVYRDDGGVQQTGAEPAQRRAEKVVAELRRLVSDPSFPVDLDFDLRPEGKQGPIVRSLDSYRAYYKRWSLAWEAQALLRARYVAGDSGLGADFAALADEIRYPHVFDDHSIREVRRIKARVEAERLPRGVDPRRHLKLGPGGISDVEWLVQLLQLQGGMQHAGLRTQSTLDALEGAVEAELLSAEDRDLLVAAWRIASSLRSATKLWSGRGSDVLPVDRQELEGIAGVCGMLQGHTTELEERWYAASRRARAVFEREFFGYRDEPRYRA